jgi:hypothetical protein
MFDLMTRNEIAATNGSHESVPWNHVEGPSHPSAFPLDGQVVVTTHRSLGRFVCVAAFGLTQADSAEQLKIDEKTLRKHFQDSRST